MGLPPRSPKTRSWQRIKRRSRDGRACHQRSFRQKNSVGSILSTAGLPAPSEATSSLPGAVNFSATSSFGAALSDTVTASDEFNAILTRFAFPQGWETDRQEAIRLLQTLPQAIRDAERGLRLVSDFRRSSTDRLGRSGNYPPDDIEDTPVEDIITDMSVAGDVLLTEISSDRPRQSTIRLATRVLKSVIGWIGRQTVWLTATVVGGVTLGVSKKFGEENADAILHHLASLAAKLTAIVDPVVHPFSSLNIPL